MHTPTVFVIKIRIEISFSYRVSWCPNYYIIKVSCYPSSYVVLVRHIPFSIPLSCTCFFRPVVLLQCCNSPCFYMYALQCTNTHKIAWLRRESRRLYVLLFSQSLLSSFPRMLSLAKLKCFSKTFQSRHVRLLILWCSDPGPSPVFITLFGQNFRFVLGGLSHCFTVPFPLQGILVTITAENF